MTRRTLVFGEGEKKSARACKDDFYFFGLGGVDAWQQDGDALSDFDDLNLDGADVVLFFDSDYRHNPNVQRALNGFARFLKSRGAAVRLAEPPDGPNGEKWGYDDCRVNLGKRKTAKIIKDAQPIELPPDYIDVVNTRYFVAREGANVLVFDEQDGVGLRTADFKTLYMNIHVPDVNGKLKELGDVWLKDPKRRQYTKTICEPDAPYDPDVHNRYKGLAFEPQRGDWSRLYDHIAKVICNGNEEYFDFVLNWQARSVQLPGTRAETALVLRGAQGTGKGVFASTHGALHAPHYYHASSANEITGRFGGHLKDIFVIFVDEAFFAGDKSHVGAFKRLITEPTITIEEKYRDRVEQPNRLKVIVASNENWVIPAGMLERRFFMLDVSPAKQQQTEYFGAIMEQMKHGGYQAYLYDLLERDISGFDHRRCPRTEALAEQQLYTMSPVELYWSEILDAGELPGTRKNKVHAGQKSTWGQVKKSVLHDNFIEQARREGRTHLPNRSQFGRQLKQLLPKGYPKNVRPRDDDRRIQIWQFPPLEECRKAFERVRGWSGWSG